MKCLLSSFGMFTMSSVGNVVDNAVPVQDEGGGVVDGKGNEITAKIASRCSGTPKP